jgi:hypothetical protein
MPAPCSTSAEDNDPWREQARRAIAIIVDELPTLPDPKVAARQRARRERARYQRSLHRQDRFWACVRRDRQRRNRGSATERGLPRLPCDPPAFGPDTFPQPPNVPPIGPLSRPLRRPALGHATAWNDALAALAAEAFRVSGSPLESPPPQLHVVARSASPLMAARWRSLIKRRGGTLTVRPGRWAIDVLEDIVTERPPAWEQELAIRYRPYLRFDSAEAYVPLDFDAFLSEKGGGQGPAHEACVEQSGPDDCTPLSDVAALEDRDYVDVSGNAELTPDVKRSRSPPQRIYYRATRWDGGIHLDYWWFFRFNVSPVATRYTCVGGLAIPEVSCFDHEGDWEGVTVTLRATESTPGQAGRAYALQAVTYAGHAWRYRYDQRLLERVGSLENGHPVVYVAWGSHASFPLPCGRRRPPGAGNCRQLGSRLPDGRRDGGINWRHNDDRSCRAANCVVALPGTRDGNALLWNAFSGRWGHEACTVGLKLCVKGKGPQSPAYQARFTDPGAAPPGSERDLLERAGLR